MAALEKAIEDAVQRRREERMRHIASAEAALAAAQLQLVESNSDAAEAEREKARYSLYLFYWPKSANTDAKGAASARRLGAQYTFCLTGTKGHKHCRKRHCQSGLGERKAL
jgi:hypothetical protein